MEQYHMAILWRTRRGIDRLVRSIRMGNYASADDAYEVAIDNLRGVMKTGDRIEIRTVIEVPIQEYTITDADRAATAIEEVLR